MFRVILWKELLDLSRDWKTLASVVLLPMLGLPGLALLAGALASVQTVTVAVVVEDGDAWGFAGELASRIASEIESRGYRANVSLVGEAPGGGYDLLVVVPEGFYDNLTRLDGTAVLRVSASLGQAGEEALAALYSAVSSLSWSIVYERVSSLAGMAGVPLDPEGLLDPLRVVTGYHSVTGAPAGPGEAEAAFTARLLEFALFFVVNPAVIYMADSVVGEKERRTIEKLLVTPASRGSILAGKMAAAFILGFAASVVDAAGLLLFFWLSGLELRVTAGLAGFWAVSAGLVILVTAAIVAGISARSTSTRSAQNASFVVMAAAMAVYFSALLVDLSRLPRAAALVLQAIPFTHAALSVHYYAVGDPLRGALHVAALAAFLAVSLLFAWGSFRGERLVMHR